LFDANLLIASLGNLIYALYLSTGTKEPVVFYSVLEGDSTIRWRRWRAVWETLPPFPGWDYLGGSEVATESQKLLEQTDVCF